MVKALVTGGTGFVGSHIARMLHDDGHEVRVLHRTTSKLDALQGLTYESAIGGLLDVDALRSACEGCEWVFHVAAVADYWRANRSHLLEVNIEGTRRVLQAAQEVGVQRVVFTSSAAAVGLRPGTQSSDETDLFNLSPHQFPYGFSKFLAEKVVAEAVQSGQDVVIVNPSVVMGPGDLNMISGSFMTQIKRFQWLTPVTSGGIAVIDVRDVARGHIAAAQKGRTGERYILNAANYTYPDWFTMIAEVLDVAKPRIHLPDFIPPVVAVVIGTARRIGIPTLIDSTQARMSTRYIYFDGSKAWRELGEPQVDMHQSIQDTFEWYRDNGYLKPDIFENVIGRVSQWLRLT